MWRTGFLSKQIEMVGGVKAKKVEKEKDLGEMVICGAQVGGRKSGSVAGTFLS